MKRGLFKNMSTGQRIAPKMEKRGGASGSVHAVRRLSQARQSPEISSGR